jgi:hypothetical protein
MIAQVGDTCDCPNDQGTHVAIVIERWTRRGVPPYCARNLLSELCFTNKIKVDPAGKLLLIDQEFFAKNNQIQPRNTEKKYHRGTTTSLLKG